MHKDIFVQADYMVFPPYHVWFHWLRLWPYP